MRVKNIYNILRANLPAERRNKMSTSKELQNLFDDLQMNAYNSGYHTYYYKDANQIIRKHFERFEKQVKVEPEVMLQVNGIISCIQHQLNLKRRKEREGIIKATYEYSLKILDIVKKEIKDTLSA